MNGYLCKVKDAQDLANKVQKMLTLTNEERETMGQMGLLYHSSTPHPHQPFRPSSRSLWP
jgi:hypothetical protein